VLQSQMPAARAACVWESFFFGEGDMVSSQNAHDEAHPSQLLYTLHSTPFTTSSQHTLHDHNEADPSQQTLHSRSFTTTGRPGHICLEIIFSQKGKRRASHGMLTLKHMIQKIPADRALEGKTKQCPRTHTYWHIHPCVYTCTHVHTYTPAGANR